MNATSTAELLEELDRLGQMLEVRGRRSSYAEFRSGRTASGETGIGERAFWQSVVAPQELEASERRSLSKASLASGGALVPKDFAHAVVDTIAANSVLGRLASQFPTVSGHDFPVPTTTAIGTAAWVAEEGTTAPVDETFGQAVFKAYRATSSVVCSQELVADSKFALDTYLAARLGQRLAVVEETGFTTGSGSGQPLGIVNASSPIAVVTAPTGSASAFKRADVLSALEALPPQYHAQASWIMSATALTGLMKIVDNGQPLFGAGPNGPTLLGLPLFVSSDMPAAGANSKAAAVGRWDLAYGVRRVRELGLQRLDEIRSATEQVEYRLIERVDGQPLVANAARLLQMSAT
jgi:HK97 family phage major capsid protein